MPGPPPFTQKDFDEAMARLLADPPSTYFAPPNYESYRLTPLWRKIRRRVLKRDGGTCLRCGGRATQAHHRRYTDAALQGEDDSVIVSLCRPCHYTVHFEAPRKPRHTWQDQEQILLEPRDALTPHTPGG